VIRHEDWQRAEVVDYRQYHLKPPTNGAWSMGNMFLSTARTSTSAWSSASRRHAKSRGRRSCQIQRPLGNSSPSYFRAIPRTCTRVSARIDTPSSAPSRCSFALCTWPNSGKVPVPAETPWAFLPHPPQSSPLPASAAR
jgi:hypothetical protein